MKKLRYIFLPLLVLLSVSCGEDFLEKPPLGSLSSGSYPETPEDAVLAVNGAYNTLRVWNFHSGGFPLLDMVADDVTKGSSSGDGGGIAPYDKFEHEATEGSMSRWWNTLYQGIRRTNLVLEYVPNIQMPEDLQNRLLGEASFLRAYFYSILIRAFGDVPKVVTVEPALDLARTPKEEIFEELILTDLEFAIEFLPEKSDYEPSDLGRATRGAAKALLSRMYLFYGDFSNAALYAEEVILSGQYDLEDDFADAFAFDREFGIESVFEIGALPEVFAQGGNQYANTFAIRGTPNRGWGFGRPAYTWISEMDDMGDSRLDPSVIFLDEELDGVVTLGDAATTDTLYDNSNNIIEIECYNQKVWHPGSGPDESFGHNRRVIRYADVLLMAAEALNEEGYVANGDAFDYLNEVRNRSGLSSLTSTELPDQGSFRQAIYDERYHEFAFEGLRFWDLIRTNRAVEVLGPLGFQAGKHELFPIPQSEVDISEGVITQNDGY